MTHTYGTFIRVQLRVAWSALALGIIPAITQAETWQVVSINGIPALAGPEIRFDDGTVSGSTGCNSFFASGQVKNNWLLVEPPVATTRRACPGLLLGGQEDTIVSLFEGEQVAFIFDPFDPTLTLVGGRTSLVLAPDTPSLEGAGADLPGTTPAAPVAGDALPPGSPAPDAREIEAQAPAPSSDGFTIFDAEYVAVHGLSGRLNIRAAATTDSRVVGGTRAGTVLVNKGCATQPDRVWCHVGGIGAGNIDGWVASEYLMPAPAALRAEDGIFDGIGRLECVLAAGAPADFCDYGFARDGNGAVGVKAFLPDGSEQVLAFQNGTLAQADPSADSVSVNRTEAGLFVEIDDRRFDLTEPFSLAAQGLGE